MGNEPSEQTSAASVEPELEPGPSALAPQLRAMISSPGIVTVALWLACALGAGVVTALLIVTALSTVEAAPTDAGSATNALLILAGSALGTGAVASAESVPIFGAQIAAGANLTLLCTGTLAAVGLAVFLIARRRARRDVSDRATPQAILLRSAIEAAAVALAVTVITGLAAYTAPPMLLVSSLTVGANSIGTFLVVWIVVCVTALLGRRPSGGRPQSPDPTGFRRAAGEVWHAAVVFAAVFTPVAVVAAFAVVVHEDRPVLGLLALPVLGNLTAIAVALGTFGSVVVSFGTSTRLWAAWDLGGGWGSLLIVLATIVLLAASVRVGALRGRTRVVRVGMLWQLPAIVLICWIPIAIGVGATASLGSDLGGGSAGVGITWWTPLLVTIGACLLSVAAEVTPGLTEQASPKLLRLLAGRRGLAAWAGSDSSTSDENRASTDTATVTLTATSVTPPTSAPATTGLDPRVRRRILVGGGVLAGIALLAVAGSVTAGILNAGRAPDAVVRQYLERLALGDAEAAAAIVDPGVPNDKRILLSDQALHAADHRLTVTAVDVTHETEASAIVTATLAVDGERFSHDFEVVRQPNELLVLNNWRLADPLLVPVHVTATASESALLGEVEIPAGSDGDDTLFAYPGTYTFTTPGSPYLRPRPATVRVLGDSYGIGASVHVEEEPTEALSKAVLAKAHERVTACATVPTNIDQICPYSVQSKDLASLTVTGLPDGLSELSAEGFRTDEAVITIQRNSGGFFTPGPEAVRFRLRGAIAFEHGEPVVSFTSSGWW